MGIYRLLLETNRDRPFHRVIPVASSLISVQHHDDQFWKSTSTSGNDHSVPVKPQFDEKFQLVHFHGTNDGTIAYEGKSPGPAFLGANVDVLPAQRTDFLFARAMGFSGRQLADDAGEVNGNLQVIHCYRFTLIWMEGSSTSSTSGAPTETPSETLR